MLLHVQAQRGRCGLRRDGMACRYASVSTIRGAAPDLRQDPQTRSVLTAPPTSHTCATISWRDPDTVWRTTLVQGTTNTKGRGKGPLVIATAGVAPFSVFFGGIIFFFLIFLIFYFNLPGCGYTNCVDYKNVYDVTVVRNTWILSINHWFDILVCIFNKYRSNV